MSRSKHHHYCRLGVEQLEARALMAGDLSIALYQDTLVINGDAQANGVQIAAGPVAGTVQVQGLFAGGANTTINRQLGPQVFTAPRSILIDLGGGDDHLQIQNVRASGMLSARLGDGNDQAVLAGVSAGTLNVDTGVGRDTLAIRDSSATGALDARGAAVFGLSKQYSFERVQVGGAISVLTGNGADVLSFNGVKAGSVNIRSEASYGNADLFGKRVTMNDVAVGGSLRIVTGGGSIDAGVANDVVALTGVSAASLHIDSGRGRDAVTVQDVNVTGSLNVQGEAYYGAVKQTTLNRVQVGELLSVTTGNGNDVVALNQVSAKSVAVNTGGGADSVTLNRVTAAQLIAALGAGDDKLSVGGCTAESVTFDGGLGKNQLSRPMPNRLGLATITRFLS